MTLQEWEKILYNLTLKTGDITSMGQYIKVAKYNEQQRRKENDLRQAQTETYNDDGGLTNC